MGSVRNVKNAMIAFLVPLPSILLYLSLNSATINGSDDEAEQARSNVWTWWYWYEHHPLLLANILFFFNVNLLFWVIGLIQSSHWVRTDTLFSTDQFTQFSFSLTAYI